MRKLVIIFVIIFLAFQSSNLRSQNNYFKFFVFSGGIINQASLSYEYAINQNHSSGIQVSASLFWLFDPYYSTKRAEIYYRYYSNLELPKRTSLFGHVEIGFYELYDYGGSSASYTRSNNISSGYLIGGRRYFGESEKWFSDIAVGVCIDYRMPNKIVDSYEGDPDYYIPPVLAENSVVIFPRMIVEVGFKF